jgi:hypothetical protein
MNSIGATVGSAVSAAIQQTTRPPRRDSDDAATVVQSQPPQPAGQSEAKPGRALDIQV